MCQGQDKVATIMQLTFPQSYFLEWNSILILILLKCVPTDN